MLEEILNETFNERELRILSFWDRHNVFQRSIEMHQYNPHFSHYDGPPFATGLPHYGHILAGTIKDVIPRYKTMKGFCVKRRFGWDCHGLPVENEIEKQFQLSGASSIEKFGIANFNEECRKIVLRYAKEWEIVVKRMGRFIDFDRAWKTMDKDFMESVWWVFKELWDKGLIYQGYKVMPFSAKLGTPLSNFEATENYKEVDDPSLIVAFPLVEDSNTSLLAWTTTPWTLISNLAIMAGPEITYVKVYDKVLDRYYILAESRLSELYKSDENYDIIDRFKGSELAGKKYIPPFDYFIEYREKSAFRVILEESVSIEDGTGLVHSAPAFGEVDFYAAEKENIPAVCPVNSNGLFTEKIPEYTGQFVKDCDKDIIRRLKEKGKVVKHTTYRHRYPFCWRSDTPLIYKIVKTWFVKVEEIKDKLLKANEKIHWMPEHIKHGRFGKWLEGARDWAISRSRYWGTPIPIWQTEDGDVYVIGSIEELQKLTGKKPEDLHRHFIDEITFEIKGKTYKRIPDVFDCWFESGSMPYATQHYPFENREHFTNNFPAEFIAEGLDQTRGWFYTLTVLSVALFDKPAFKNVVVNGIILAEDGSKMSKRLKNYPDPMEVVEKYGADAIRLYMMHSPAVKAEDLRFSESGVELVLRQILIPFWNAYSFFVTYARIYDWKPQSSLIEKPHLKTDAVIDQWIVSRINKLIYEVEHGMHDYDLSRAVEPFIGFVEDLTNWYIRRSRRRFWTEKYSEDRDQAFATLYYVLLNLCKIAAPFVPFITEAIWCNLRNNSMPDSVHLSRFPNYDKEKRNKKLEEAMNAVQKAVSLGHALRKENKLKVRQPLKLATLISKDEKLLNFLKGQKHLISDELNVKDVHFAHDEEDFVSLSAKPIFPILGKRFGPLMRQVQKEIEALNTNDLDQLQKGLGVKITIDGDEYDIHPDDVEIRRQVKEGLIASNSGNLTIALDTAINTDLEMEGMAREIVNKINTMRRDLGFDVTDRVHVTIDSTEKVKKSFNVHGIYIQNEVLARSFKFEPCEGKQWDLNGEMATISIQKA